MRLLLLTLGRRDQLVILDDPAFEPDFQLPDFRLDDDGNLSIANMSQSNTQRMSSQMSPHTADGSFGSPFGAAIHISASPGGSFRGLHQLETPFGRDSMSSQKPRYGGAGEEDEPLVMDDDWGIRIDDDGNIVLADEPQLPELPLLPSDPAAPDVQQNAPAPFAPQPDDEIMVNMGGDMLLPDAEAFPQRRSNDMDLQESSSVAAAPVRRRRRRVTIRPDRETMISRSQINAWAREYAARSDEARKTARPATQGQARKTAYDLTFGFGIAHVGEPRAIPGMLYPLAEHFAGAGLQRAILGFVLDSPSAAEESRGRRRTSGEAFGLELEDRRVRARLDDDDNTPQAGRSQDPATAAAQMQYNEFDMPMFEPEPDTELGREAPGSALSADISAPWNRAPPGSASLAGSSGVKRTTTTGRQVSASPLHGRGAGQGSGLGLPPIERFSSDNDALLPFGSDGCHHHPSSIRRDDDEQQQRTSQATHAALDQEGRNFLSFAQDMAAERGETRDDADGRSWIGFESLFAGDASPSRAVAAQAFFHVLALATRGVVKVEQEGAEEGVPFGTIRVGVVVVAAAVEGDEGDGDEGVVGGV